MFISDHLRLDNILFEETLGSKTDTLHRLTQLMADNGDLADAEACLEALLEREKLMTTGVGKGVALPHAFSTAVNDTVIAYLRAKGGVDFVSVDGQPVHHIFCILGPPSAQGRHLKILARLARMLNHASFLEALDAADAPPALLDALRHQEEALSPH